MDCLVQFTPPSRVIQIELGAARGVFGIGLASYAGGAVATA